MHYITDYHRAFAASLGVDADEWREQGELMAEYDRRAAMPAPSNPDAATGNVAPMAGQSCERDNRPPAPPLES